MTKLPISAIILTYNEEKNIETCLKSLEGLVENIFIVDSYSDDLTVEIASMYTDKIFQHPFENYAKQLNWALKNLPINTEWVMRIDADERVMPALRGELLNQMYKLDSDITGLYIKVRVYFMGRWMKHGGTHPVWHLRIWRKDKAYCEERWMDEHMKVIEGKLSFFESDIIDENRKKLHWWIGKHNNYATREAIDILNLGYGFINYDETIPPRLFGRQEQRKRWIKEKIYANMPLFIRPILYFIYRYTIQLGFLDGKEGLIWHVLQGFWYRFLVDSKVYEIKRRARSEGKSAREVISEIYGIKFEK